MQSIQRWAAFAALAVVSYSQPSYAMTEIHRGGHFVYFSYPWSEACKMYSDSSTALTDAFGEVLSDVRKTSSEFTTVRISDLPDNPTFKDQIARLTKNIPNYVESINQRSPHSGIGGLCPDAFMVSLLGVKVSGDLGAAFGAQTSVNLIIMPYVVKRIDIRTGKVATFYLKADWAVAINGAGSVGAGVGGGVGTHFGLGLIWGMQKASDFHGNVVSVAGTIKVLGGTSLRVGRLFQTTRGISFRRTGPAYTFAQAVFDVGLEAEAAATVEGGSYIMLDDIMAGVFGQGVRPAHSDGVIVDTDAAMAPATAAAAPKPTTLAKPTGPSKPAIPSKSPAAPTSLASSH